VRVTRRADAALRAMQALAGARLDARAVLPVRELARRSGVPAPFLQQVLLGLRRGGVVASRGGRYGGYRLARPAAAISVGEVLRTAQPDLGPMPCAARGARGACADEAGCRARPVWVRVRRATERIVDGITLAELAA